MWSCAARGIEKGHGGLGTKLALVKQAMGFVTVGRSVVVEHERVQVDATYGMRMRPGGRLGSAAGAARAKAGGA